MESRQQASLPGHNIATTTDAGCLGDAVQTHAFHHGGYSRALAEVLSTPIELILNELPLMLHYPGFAPASPGPTRERLEGEQVCSAWEASIE